jgi:hypothetical protein
MPLYLAVRAAGPQAAFLMASSFYVAGFVGPLRGLSQPLDRARREAIIVVGDLQHRLFAHVVGHQAGQRARILRALTPVFRIVVEQRHRIPHAREGIVSPLRVGSQEPETKLWKSLPFR